jgi:hypothetical protein
MQVQRFTNLLGFLTTGLLLAGCNVGISKPGDSGTPPAATAPAITTQPKNQTVIAGETATFSVIAAGTGPLSYQWQKGSATITGATSASYTTPVTSTADSGSQFTVVVSNSDGSITSNAATLTVNAAPTVPSIIQQPSNQTVNAGQTATFSVMAVGVGTLSYQWQKGTSPINGATSAGYTTPPTTTADNGAQFSVVVSNANGKVTSNAATLTVSTSTPPSTLDVLTYHNDIARTGQNLSETALTTSNVTSATFGKLGFYSVDGLVDAQPLYASTVAIPGNGTHNILIIATEHDSVYAFDADSGASLWQVSMLEAGETTSDPRSCDQVSPEIGVTSTPVIDRASGPNGAVYVVAMSKNGSTYHQRLHALDLALGTELFGGPVDIQATYPGTGDNSNGTDVVFDPAQYKERAALLLLNGTIYTGWASHCDIRPYTGWIMGYSESTLAQTSVLNVTPNGNEGAIWMAGAGLAADSSANIYFLDANGVFDTTLNAGGFPTQGDYGNAFMKLSTSGNRLAVADYFEMDNGVAESDSDTDLGSGGLIVLPDLNDGSGHTWHLAVGAGKDSNLYVVNRDSMGKFTSNNNSIYQELPGALSGGVYASPAYFNNTIYYGSVGSPIQAFTITNAQLSTSATSQTANSFGYPGTTPSISANGTSNGIVWAVENNSPAVLHTYDATNLNEIYNSNQASGGRDQFGDGNKFMTPTIVNGKVFVGTPNGVAVFGLLP